MSLFPFRIFRALTLLILLFSVLHGSETPYYSDAQRQWIKEHPVITVGAERDWAPFDFVDASGEYRGFAREMLERVARYSGLKFRYEADQWDTLLEKAKAGNIDLLPAINYSNERAKSLHFSDAYYNTYAYIFSHIDSEVTSLDDLEGKTAAIPKSYQISEVFQRRFPKSRILEVETLDDAIEAVLLKRADLLVDTYAVLNYKLREKGIQTIRPFHPLYSNALYMAAPRANAQSAMLIGIINETLESITEQQKEEMLSQWIVLRPNQQKALGLSKAEMAWIAAHPKVILGSDRAWPPFEFLDEQGRYQGIAADFIRLIALRSGLDIEVKPNIWSTTLSQMREGKFDGLSCAVKTPQRSTFLDFTTPYVSVESGLVVRRDSESIRSITDLGKKTVAINKDSYMHEWLKTRYPEIKILGTRSNEEAIEAVAYGKADAYIGNLAVYSYVIEKKMITNLKVVAQVTEQVTQPAFAVDKSQPLLASILQKALDSISQAERQQIMKKWYSESVEAATLLLSDAESKWLSEHPVITFSGHPDWLPFEAFRSDGSYEGIVAQYLKEIEKSILSRFEPVASGNGSEKAKRSEQRDADVISSDFDDTALMRNYRPVTPYLKTPVVIVMRGDHDFVSDVDAIESDRIGIIEGHGYIEKLHERYPQRRFVRFDTAAGALESLSLGKIDAVLVSMPKAGYLIRTRGYSNLKIVGKTSVEMQLTLFVHQSKPLLHAILEKALENIPTNRHSTIIREWMDVEFAKKTDYTLLLQVGALFLLFLLATLYWNRKLSREIRERRHVEEALLIEKENFKLLFEKGSDGTFIVQGGKFVTCNAAALKMLGVQEPSELVGTSPLDWSPALQPDGSDSKTRITEMARMGKKQGSYRFEWVYCDASGREFWVDVILTKIIYQGKTSSYVVCREITQQKELEAELTEATQAAIAADRSKSEFLANMSHEIRTPMNAIIGFTDLLGEQLKEPRLRSYVSTIQTAGKTLLNLINDILDLSKIESGKMTLLKKPTHLEELFEEIGSIFSITVRNKGLSLIIDMDETLPESLLVDSTRLRQVLFNLLGNAVKFTEHGHIALRLHTMAVDEHRSKVDLEIIVEDTGIGIPENQVERIFNIFEQQEGQDSRKFGGTGLGLTISKRLCEMMGGKIRVESSVGKGSRFIVSLYGIDIASVLSERRLDKVTGFDAEHIVFRPGRLLVVDDVEDNRQLIMQYFEETALETFSAANGAEAVAMVVQQPIDLIIMDIRMPVMDGYEAARRIKASWNLPIIALTASVMQSELDRLQDANFDGYLRKPVLRRELFYEVSRFLAHAFMPHVGEREEKVLLSQKAILNLPDILQVLTTTITQTHQRAKSTNSISEITALAKQIEALGGRYNVEPLEQYASKLFEALDAFDIALLQRLLGTYDALVDTLASHRK